MLAAETACIHRASSCCAILTLSQWKNTMALVLILQVRANTNSKNENNTKYPLGIEHILQSFNFLKLYLFIYSVYVHECVSVCVC